MGRPGKTRRVRASTRVGLRACRRCERGEARAEACVWRS
jgi:hypothetical protein